MNVQGSTFAVSAFQYSSDAFFLPLDGGDIDSSTIGFVTGNFGADGHVPNQADPTISNDERAGLEAGPAALPIFRQFLQPKWRVAIYVNKPPASYRGEPMPLAYRGNVVADVTVENVSPSPYKPQDVYFYENDPILGRCN
jgi:hypothetical protein